MIKKCLKCNNDFKTYPNWVKRGEGKYCSSSCFASCRVGSKNPNWVGDKVKYQGIHDWLRYTIGYPNKCESKKCTGISKSFVWALKKGKKYERKRSNFKMLCRSCHNKYDMNDSWRKNISIGLLKILSR